MSKLKPILLAIVATAFTANLAISDAFAAGKEIVAYRLAKAKTLEFEDTKKADQHYSTVKKLGCEAKKDNHNGHVDVTYRCSKWRQLELDSHKAAHAWERWLKASGFETKHTH